ncbi:hypothetical protein EJB05_27429, partial [Eragrostis curvula]
NMVKRKKADVPPDGSKARSESPHRPVTRSMSVSEQIAPNQHTRKRKNNNKDEEECATPISKRRRLMKKTVSTRAKKKLELEDVQEERSSRRHKRKRTMRLEKTSNKKEKSASKKNKKEKSADRKTRKKKSAEKKRGKKKSSSRKTLTFAEESAAEEDETTAEDEQSAAEEEIAAEEEDSAAEEERWAEEEQSDAEEKDSAVEEDSGAEEEQSDAEEKDSAAEEDSGAEEESGAEKLVAVLQSPKKTKKDIRKRGSAKRTIELNENLSEPQKQRIRDFGFGGLLEIKLPYVPEKLSKWLLSIFNTETCELEVPFRGPIKVDDEAVNRIFELPMGTDPVVYKMRKNEDTFNLFYELVGAQSKKAPTFKDELNWFQGEGKDRVDDNWLRRWLIFVVSAILYPNAGEKLTILYLDSLKTGISMNNRPTRRIGFWDKELVDKVIKMDKNKRTGKFGVLKLKENVHPIGQVLIGPQKVLEFASSSVPPQTSREIRQIISDALTSLSTRINVGVSQLVIDILATGNPPQTDAILIEPDCLHEIVQSCAPQDASAELVHVVSDAIQKFISTINQGAASFVQEVAVGRAQVNQREQELIAASSSHDACNRTGEINRERRSKNRHDPRNMIEDEDQKSLEDYGNSDAEDGNEEVGNDSDEENSSDEDGRTSAADDGVHADDDDEISNDDKENSGHSDNDDGEEDDSDKKIHESISKDDEISNDDKENSGQSDNEDGEEDHSDKNNPENIRSPERGNNDDSVNPSQQSTDTIISSTLKDINSHTSAGNRAEHEDEDEDDRITLSHLLERKLKNVRADENKEARNSDDNEKKDDVGDKNEDEDNDGNDEEEDRDKDATNKKKKDDDDDDDGGQGNASIKNGEEEAPDEGKKDGGQQGDKGESEGHTQRDVSGAHSDEIQNTQEETSSQNTCASGSASEGLSDQVNRYLKQDLQRAPVVPEEPRMIEQHIFFEPKTKIDVFEGLETLPNANLEFLPNNQCEERITELLKVEKVELTKEQRKRLRDPFGAKNKRTKSTGHNPGKPLRKQIAERALEKNHALEKEGDTSKEKTGVDTSLSESAKKDEGLPTDQKYDGVKSDKASHEDSSKAAIPEGLSTDQKDDGVKSDKANHEDSSKAATANYVIYQRKKKDAKKVSFAEPEQTPHVASIGARQQERKTSRKVPASKVNKDVQDTSKVPIKLSKAFQDVPNAPSFSLGVSSQESGDSLTDSIAAEAFRQADEVTPLECRIYPNINIATANKFIASREAEHLYNHVCTWRTRDASLSPVIFDNGNIKATASEIATSIAPCRCFESLVIAIAAQVLSTAKGQERKKFLSTYDTYRNLVMQQLIMAEGYLDSQRLLNLFNKNHRNFDYIMLPIYEPITERRKATDAHEGGHWFLVIVNFKDKQFDVVDSFRKPINAKLQDTSRKVKAKIVNLWNKVTSKREDGQVKDVWRFPIKYFEGFKQLN